VSIIRGNFPSKSPPYISDTLNAFTFISIGEKQLISLRSQGRLEQNEIRGTPGMYGSKGIFG